MLVLIIQNLMHHQQHLIIQVKLSQAAQASFLNSKESYKVLASSGLFGLSSPLISVDTSPTWSTASGNIASVIEEPV